MVRFHYCIDRDFSINRWGLSYIFRDGTHVEGILILGASSTFGEVSPWRSRDVESVFLSLKEHKRCAGKRSEQCWRGRVKWL